MSPFKRYIHVERLDSDECAGLLENDGVYVTAKVDGSNGSVWWDGDAHHLACASRNNVLGLDEDNAGFCAWCATPGDERDRLMAFCEQHPHLVVFGEWMGQRVFTGAFKGYDARALGALVIFDVFDRNLDEYLPDACWRPMLAEAGLERWFVRVLAILDHPTVDDVARIGMENDFLLEGTGMVGEGVVCKAPGWRNAYGRQAYGKIVLDEFKRQRKAARESIDVEREIVVQFMTDAEMAKSVAKVCVACSADAFDATSRKMMGMLQSMCWRDLLDECANWVKKFKKPTVNFGQLSGACNARVADYVSEHFG